MLKEIKTNREIRTLNELLTFYEKGETVLVRVDFNVPLSEDGKITDTTRIDKSVLTIRTLMDVGLKVALCSHLGDPINGPEKKFSLKQIVNYLEEALDRDVIFVDDCITAKIEKILRNLNAENEVILLENLRFYKEEKSKDEKVLMEFAEKLVKPFNYVVNEAFGASHRDHASFRTGKIRSAYAGFLMQKELEICAKYLVDLPENSMVILGGAKVSSKLNLLRDFIKRFKTVAIVGGMAHTFFKALGMSHLDETNSCVEDDMLGDALNIIREGENIGCNVILPVDVIIGCLNTGENETYDVLDLSDIPKGWEILDAGDKTIKVLKEAMEDADLIFWNGPLGKFEFYPFNYATFEIADIITDITGAGIITLIGGGDTASAFSQWLEAMCFTSSDEIWLITYVFTGGGSTLEYILLPNGETLPGIEIVLKPVE